MNISETKCCGSCQFWEHSYKTAGICIALIGRTDVPDWAPRAANACRHEKDGINCPVFVALYKN
jgi:hypothetical protein